MMENKTCVRCKKTKPLSNYRKSKNNKDGYKGVCKECLKLDDLKYRVENSVTIKSKAKIHRENNKEKNNAMKTKWRKNNPDYNKKWRKNNPEKVKRLAKLSAKNFRKKYPIKVNLRNLIYKSLIKGGFNKKSRTHEILGCSFEEFKIHLESQFEPWMTWENYGNPKDGILEENKTWDMDHIIPLSTATCEGDIIKLNHFSNFQPLCSYENRFVKRNTH